MSSNVGLRRLSIRDCDFECRQGIKIYRDNVANGWGIHSVAIERCHFRGVAAGTAERSWGEESVGIEIADFGVSVIDKVDFNGFARAIYIPQGGTVVKNARIEMVSYAVDVQGGGVLKAENFAIEAPYQCGINLEGASYASLNGIYIANDGWENNNTGGIDGIRFAQGRYFLQDVTVAGARTGGALVFVGGMPTKSVFMGVDATTSSPGVAWKGFAPTSNLTLLQCNNP